MPINSNFDLDAVFEGINRKFDEQIIPAIIEQLESVCIEIVAEAKQLDTYKDRTGNLRSSIGYVIYKDGKKIGQLFTASPGKDSKDGGVSAVKKGEQIADEAARSWPTGIVAVIVAGMDYALYVESNGKDVITGPSLKIKNMLRERLQDIKDVYK